MSLAGRCGFVTDGRPNWCDAHGPLEWCPNHNPDKLIVVRKDDLLHLLNGTREQQNEAASKLRERVEK